MDENPMPETPATGDPQKTTEQKLDALSTSVDKRFDDVDKRFDAVAEALVEQRKYTEFAFDKLATEMKAGFDKVEGRFDQVEGRLDQVEGRFDRVEGRFDQVEGRLDQVEGRFDRVEGRFDRVEGRFDRIERKLDQFIDTQARANELVERRLQALEPPKPRNR